MSDAASHGTTRAPRRETLRTAVSRVCQCVHRIIGAPDYDAYVEHVRRCHPGRTPLARDEFFRQRLDDRYNRVGARCC